MSHDRFLPDEGNRNQRSGRCRITLDQRHLMRMRLHGCSRKRAKRVSASGRKGTSVAVERIWQIELMPFHDVLIDLRRIDPRDLRQIAPLALRPVARRGGSRARRYPDGDDVRAKPARDQSQQDRRYERGASRIGGASLRSPGLESDGLGRLGLEPNVGAVAFARRLDFIARSSTRFLSSSATLRAPFRSQIAVAR